MTHPLLSPNPLHAWTNQAVLGKYEWDNPLPEAIQILYDHMCAMEELVRRQNEALEYARERLCLSSDRGFYPIMMLVKNGGKGLQPMMSALSAFTTFKQKMEGGQEG